MKKVTIVRPDGSKLILEGATPEEILKLSPAPVYYTYPSPPFWWWNHPYVAAPQVGPMWIGTAYAVNKTIIGNANVGGGMGGSGSYTLTSNAGASV